MKEYMQCKFTAIRTFILACFVFAMNTQQKAAGLLPPTTRMSVLTCTPGENLYSTFGHSAIRVAGEFEGKTFDVVYNYGTFDFTDDFYFQFCMGRLNYTLSRSSFAEFQIEYIESNRGIYEQDLLLDSADKQKLFNLLEENYLPENRVYRYDFFYDNCSTRIRDILMKATINTIGFTYAYHDTYTFRNAIDRYLVKMPWADFGIDLILGCPTDHIMEKNQAMFLPDSLMNELNYTTYKDGALVSQTKEILPAESEESELSFWHPLRVNFIFFILLVVLGFIFIRRYNKSMIMPDRALFFLSGLLGIVILFLWFITDHHQTIWNLNIVWANPMNLVLAFSGNKLRTKLRNWMIVYAALLLILLSCWFILPQQLSISAIPLTAALLFSMIKLLRPDFFNRSNRYKTKP